MNLNTGYIVDFLSMLILAFLFFLKQNIKRIFLYVGPKIDCLELVLKASSDPEDLFLFSGCIFIISSADFGVSDANLSF